MKRLNYLFGILNVVLLIYLGISTYRYIKIKRLNEIISWELSNNEFCNIDWYYDNIEKNVYYYHYRDLSQYLELNPHSFDKTKSNFWMKYIKQKDTNKFNERIAHMMNLKKYNSAEIDGLANDYIYRELVNYGYRQTVDVLDCFKKFGRFLLLKDIKDSVYFGFKYYDLTYLINGKKPIQKSLNTYEVPFASALNIETHKVIYNDQNEVLLDTILDQNEFVLTSEN